MLRVIVLVACVLAAPMLAIDSQAQTPAAVRYTVLMMGKSAGAQTTLIKPDGVREFTFEYNDRGRGPLLASRIKVDPQGLPVAVETSGNDYMKAEVKETFTLTNGLARWKNDGESGEKKLSAPAFYINMQSVPEQSAALARALLESSGRRLALLPDGEASIRQTSELTLTQNTRTLRVRAYEITGLGFTPGTVWLDENNEFFAEVSSWLTTIREGWESSAPRLLADQDAIDAFMTAQQFVEAGADELQHINFVFLNFFFDEVKDTRTPARFVAVAERAGSLDLNSDRVRSFVSKLRTRGVVVDPTVSIFEGLFTDRPGTMALGYAPVADRLPPQVRRELLAGGLAVPEGKDQAYRQSSQALLRMIKLLYDNGVTLVAGTDSMPGFTLHRELELYVAAGIPAREVLRIATLGAARVTGRDKELGTIAPGKLADLILVDGDPALRISDIRRTSLVLKDGKIFDPAALYGSIGVRAR